MKKTYIVFDDAPVLEEGLPSGVAFVTTDIFSVKDVDSIPVGARVATEAEMATPDEVLAQIAEDITLAGDKFQTDFLGATSPKREARFSMNLAVAKRLIADEYGDNAALKAADTQSMTMQTTAQNEGRDALEFAQWIVEWESKSVLISGAIEAFIKTSKLALPSVPNLIDPTVKAQHYAALKAQVKAMFKQMTA